MTVSLRIALPLSLALVAGCPSTDEPPPEADDDDAVADDDDAVDDDDSGVDDDDAVDDDDSAGVEPRPPLPWDDDACVGISQDGAGYAGLVAKWNAQDDLSATPPGPLVVTGSSSVRRWDGAHRDLSPWGRVVQRGFGGSRLYDVAAWAEQLVLRHEPRAVVVFAGTNDVAGGDDAATVLVAYRCLAQRVYALDPPTPLFFIGITPTPSRWANWDRASAVNAGVADYAEQHPELHYIDTPEAFLRTGEPPDASLFVGDRLHLSVAGYALWTAVIDAALSDALPLAEPDPNPAHPASGARILVDLGPDNPEDGTATTVDAAGLHWNSWHSTDGGAPILAGERLGDLVTTDGTPSGVGLVVAGGFLSNGLLNGGLQNPDPARLGDLAVGTATQDYFYVDGADTPGGLGLTGLDPARTYTLRVFASRATGETRVTRYRVDGAATAIAELTTSGADIGADGYDGNDATIVEFSALAPDAGGRLHLDVATAQGPYSYVALLELEVE